MPGGKAGFFGQVFSRAVGLIVAVNARKNENSKNELGEYMHARYERQLTGQKVRVKEHIMKYSDDRKIHKQTVPVTQLMNVCMK